MSGASRPTPKHGDAIPEAWNSTRVDFGGDLLLHALFEAQADRTPDAIALRFAGNDLTYRELNARANRLAHHLIKTGASPNALIAVVAERSFEMVVALLAVLKAGGAYVPTDPSYPKARLSYMLEDSSPAIRLVQEHLIPFVPESSGTLVLMDNDSDWENEPDSNPEVPLKPSDLAYMIYTSGSTGQPKGALNTHAAIVNRLLWMQSRYELDETDSIIQKTPFSFDVSGWEFFWPLIVGARMVIARPEGHKDPAYLSQLIRDESVTVSHFVPSMLQIFLGETNLKECCSSLRHVICSGETLTRPLQDRFFSALDADLHNLYGPTEAAIDVTHWTCRRDWDEPVIPIGRPVANTQIYIVDSAGQQVPVGETGELWIGGVQVARGYLNREDLTRERFIPNPFSSDSGSSVYRTGDLARWRPDGNIDFLGRMDHQVKILGVRIELGEVEAAIESNPAVKQAVVLAREDSPGELRLVAYLQLKSGQSLAIGSLRTFLQAQLPEALIPAAFVIVEAIPLSSSGKVDRAVLPAPSRERPALEQAYVAPRTPVERAISVVWTELLQIDDIGTRDRFFDLGGNSLLAAQFIRQMEDRLGENIYIVSIFDAPSIAEYARFLETDYSESVAKAFGGARAPRLKSNQDDLIIDEAAVTRMRARIPVLSKTPPPEPDPTPNPQAIFVLAPPRSGTTLLRVMLAGHPDLFAAAELQLLGFHTLADRNEAFQGKFSLWGEGTQRCIMELKNCDAATAKQMMTDFEKRGLTTKQFYAVLQGWIGKRTLVDKSPSYVLDPASLEKAERDFQNPLYIHLTRHPLAMMQSFERYHMEQVLFVESHSFSSRQLAELVWHISHENTLRFLEHIPASRQARLRYEDLVTTPETALLGCCESLGLPFHPGLVDPYKDIEQKMVDGIHSVSAPMGDTRLLGHGKIDPSLANAWKQGPQTLLGKGTWEIARQFGYESLDGHSKPDETNDSAQNRATRRGRLRQARAARSRHRGKIDSKGDSQ